MKTAWSTKCKSGQGGPQVCGAELYLQLHRTARPTEWTAYPFHEGKVRCGLRQTSK